MIVGAFCPMPAPLMNRFRPRAPHCLARAVLCMATGLVLTTGCATRQTSGSTSQAVSSNPVVIDAALAEDVLGCAEDQFRAAGYATHRDVRTPRAIRAEREASVGDGYELNVTGAALRSVDGNPNILRLTVWAETRAFRSRDINSGYEIRSTPRGEVQQLARTVMARCAMN
jgi:hypothetical protein